MMAFPLPKRRGRAFTPIFFAGFPLHAVVTRASDVFSKLLNSLSPAKKDFRSIANANSRPSFWQGRANAREMNFFNNGYFKLN
jgi:hypothetical protein